MRSGFVVMSVIVLSVFMCCANAFAWEVYYDGSRGLPQYGPTAWQEDENNYYGACGFKDNAFHMVDQSLNSTVRFYREGYMGFTTPVDVTMEVRIKVASGSVGFGVSSSSGGGVGVWTDKIGLRSGNDMRYYYVDLTQFRTIRLATRSSDHSIGVWVDGIQAFSQGANGPSNSGGVSWGSSWAVEGNCDAYWDYVAYSKDYLPVPEPSSLAGLGCSLLAIAGLAIRRRC